ncbi:MAG: hypothetical protein H7061_01420 [Bdellovibrionaceae bacterium]|nr:hypothetical protein [Bdellovibrio sp.]
MTTIEKTVNSKNRKIIFLFLALAILIAVLSSLPAVQKLVQPMLQAPSRQILAKVSTVNGIRSVQYLILKVKDSSGLQIEIYQVNPDTLKQELRQKFDLTQDGDAYMTINKNSSNLALSDIDHDGHLDILAPSVDRNGNLRLNTFRFNSDLQNFEPYSQSSDVQPAE